MSPRPAVDTPGVPAQVERFKEIANRRILWVAPLMLLLVFAATAVTDTGLFPFVAGPVGACFVLGWVLTVKSAPKKTLRILADNRWQVWPCRLEAIPGKSLERRILLLAPDKSVAASFRGRVPKDVWLGMADGRGVLWFAGDLRFPSVAALPGGAPLWSVVPEKPEEREPEPRRGGDGEGGSALDELVSEARSAVVWNMLG
ncbi:hypothetical protein ACH5A7_25945 [Streptomyces sp. NPDC018955]|uniref:hypothetical protein n=1 Tax=Streptomyces sp. NPDC018955 TaxID=3365055 RepID=UPI0037B26387